MPKFEYYIFNVCVLIIVIPSAIQSGGSAVLEERVSDPDMHSFSTTSSNPHLDQSESWQIANDQSESLEISSDQWKINMQWLQ